MPPEVGVWAPKDSGRIRAAEIGQLSSQSTDEWGIERGELCKVLAGLNFQPEVDCMATRTSTVCGKFFAAQPQQGVAGVDELAVLVRPASRSEISEGYSKTDPVQTKVLGIQQS